MLEIGKKLRSLRQEKGWSQGDVAKLLNISVAAFSKIETDVTDVSISRIQQLAEIFQVSVFTLLSVELTEPVEQSEALRKAKDTIAEDAVKIMQLQEYIIKLYEQINVLRSQQVPQL